jgi:hypothetical protein
MRLLDLETYELETFDESQCAPEDDKKQPEIPYIVLSHRWIDKAEEGKEVQFDDMRFFKELREDPFWDQKVSVDKIVGACKAAKEWIKEEKKAGSQEVGQSQQSPIKHLWIDTCCIDQKNQGELSAAINSMHRWYKRARVCLVYLSDVNTPSEFTASKWFARGWTLQELVAPRYVRFYDKNWRFIGTKETLQDDLQKRTMIDADVLAETKNLRNPSVGHRMSWFRGRETRVPEDNAYCLMGLFDVHMPTIYGEGLESAFRRLQEEIIKYSDDHTIFAWKDTYHPAHEWDDSMQVDLLARSPRCFSDTGNFCHKPNRWNNKPYRMTNKGLSISVYLLQHRKRGNDIFIATLDCPVAGQGNLYLGVYLKRLSAATQQYCRVFPHKTCEVEEKGRGPLTEIFIKKTVNY